MIKNIVSVEGVGFYIGKIVKLIFYLVLVDYGYKFQCIDMEKEFVLSVDINCVVFIQWGIIIKVGQVEVYIVEYVLFVFFGLGVDNVFIQLDGLEVFILDGSVGFFVKVLQKVGIEI